MSGSSASGTRAAGSFAAGILLADKQPFEPSQLHPLFEMAVRHSTTLLLSLDFGCPLPYISLVLSVLERPAETLHANYLTLWQQ